LLYRQLKFAPAVRWVSGQLLFAASYAENTGLPPLHSWPSWTKPVVRPPASERSTPNQLYRGFVPPAWTACAQAALVGWMLPCGLRPSRQHRYVRLPGCIMAPCAWTVVGAIATAVVAATTTVAE
jgi:hypothetical protein